MDRHTYVRVSVTRLPLLPHCCIIHVQAWPVKAVVLLPQLSLSHGCIDFGCGFVEQTVSKSFSLHNHGYSSALWTAQLQTGTNCACVCVCMCVCACVCVCVCVRACVCVCVYICLCAHINMFACSVLHCVTHACAVNVRSYVALVTYVC